jgi:hypothetical protein
MSREQAEQIRKAGSRLEWIVGDCPELAKINPSTKCSQPRASQSNRHASSWASMTVLIAFEMNHSNIGYSFFNFVPYGNDNIGITSHKYSSQVWAANSKTD